VAVTKHLLIAYGTLVKQTASISTIPKWNLQFKTGFIIRLQNVYERKKKEIQMKCADEKTRV